MCLSDSIQWQFYDVYLFKMHLVYPVFLCAVVYLLYLSVSFCLCDSQLVDIFYYSNLSNNKLETLFPNGNLPKFIFKQLFLRETFSRAWIDAIAACDELNRTVRSRGILKL